MISIRVPIPGTTIMELEGTVLLGHEYMFPNLKALRTPSFRTFYEGLIIEVWLIKSSSITQSLANIPYPEAEEWD